VWCRAVLGRYPAAAAIAFEGGQSGCGTSTPNGLPQPFRDETSNDASNEASNETGMNPNRNFKNLTV